MKAVLVPMHFSLTMSVQEADTLRRCLSDVKDDAAFGLNEHEEEVISEMISLLSHCDEDSVT